MSNRATIISSKEQFKQWVLLDRKSSGFKASMSLKDKIHDLFAPNYISNFLYLLRKVEYITNCKTGPIWGGYFCFIDYDLENCK